MEKSPKPAAQMTHPKRMHSRYRPTQWTTRPETVLLAATRDSQLRTHPKSKTGRLILWNSVMGSNMAPAFTVE